MSKISQQQIEAGGAVYTPLMLKIYNLYVLSFSNYWIWRCAKKKQLKQYQMYRGKVHCDIGVGTGFYLQHCNWPQDTQLTLFDLNQNSLNQAKMAISTLDVDCIKGNIYERNIELGNHFDAISANYLLHCLPGTMSDKCKVLENIAYMLKPNGRFFGASILSDENLHTWASKKLMRLYNKKGIFTNYGDSAQALEDSLRKSFSQVDIKIQGCVALFHCLK